MYFGITGNETFTIGYTREVPQICTLWNIPGHNGTSLDQCTIENS